MARRRILFLSYYFPPLGGAGVQRSVKFLRYLPEHGYDAVVVTGPTGASDRWAPPDDTLAGELPASAVSVVRVGGRQPPRAHGMRGRLERWLRLESAFARWWVEGTSAAAATAGPADLVFATMSPFESAAAAASISRGRRIPWIADLRDPWALDDWLVYPTRLHRRLEQGRMRSALSTADAIVMNTPEATKQLLAHFPELRGKEVVTIPNGYDASDFARAAPERTDGAFRIVHAGYAHTASGRRHRRVRLLRRALGGAAPGLEILTRSHLYLQEAVARVLAEEPDLHGRVELHLAGAASGGGEAPDFVRHHGYLPHDETVALLQSADLLFLPMHDLRPGTRARIVPGKTYEYLASRRPILAAVPDGDARDLLSEARTATLCRPADAAGMAAAVRAAIDSWRRGEQPAPPPAELLARYERRRLTGDLAALFDRVLAAAANS